jgi:calsyntenin 1
MNKVLSEEEIKCGMNCAERLISPDEKFMKINQQVQINSQMNEITVEGTERKNVEELMQKIQYLNDKVDPTIGRRNINVVTTVSCPLKKAIRLPTIDTFIMINRGLEHVNISEISTTADYQDISQDELKPQITISGNQNNLVSYHDIKSGVKFLEKVNIAIYSNDQIQENLQKLDSCNVNGMLKLKLKKFHTNFQQFFLQFFPI